MSMHQNTPTLTVSDPRGLAVRTVSWHRSAEQDTVQVRNMLQHYDAIGRLNQQWDPRLGELSDLANQSTRYSLSGQVLLTESVDAGWRLACHDAAGQLRDSWDGRDTHRRYGYDELMRPVGIFEDEPPLCVERFTYAGADKEDARYNRCGQLLRHDDQAGSLWHEAFALTGQPLSETRRFCTTLAPPQWPASEADLEDSTYTTRWRHDALGAVIEQIDALEHVQRFEFDAAGQPFASWLDDVALLKSTTYNAFGHVESELAGNDVTTTAYYSARGGLLSNLKAKRLDGKTLQDLHYQYDPVGNITRIEDLAQPVQWFAGQRIQAVSTYTYDTLYQLISASGRENASQTIGPGLPGLEIFGPVDDSRWRTYSQTYRYDSGGNLTQLKHDAGTGNRYTREMVVDARSNRSLFKDGSPIDFAKAFDANGNQQALAPSQVMQWDSRNQLQHVTQVQREDPDGQDDDTETYVYDGGGQRVRKVRWAKTRGGEQVSEVHYLPGLEIRTRTAVEIMHVVIAQAGRNGVRLLHRDDGRRKEIANDQLRYSLSDHLGSSTLELDQTGDLLSQESYYPYGGTAWWAAKSAIEAKNKLIRYSGKERDATGLYYYGFRYYAPWLQRWISSDPAGDVDGLNLYRMVRNNPMSLKDKNGLITDEQALKKYEVLSQSFESPSAFLQRTNRQFLYRAIRVTESSKRDPRTGSQVVVPPEGDVFNSPGVSILERAQQYRTMVRWPDACIVAADPELTQLPLQHVSGDNGLSQYISTGSEGAAAYNTMYNWNSSGLGLGRRARPEASWDPIVEIDVRKLDSDIKIVDMQREVFHDPDRPQITQIALVDSEVLVVKKINASAITRIFTDHTVHKEFLKKHFPAGTAAPVTGGKRKLSEEFLELRSVANTAGGESEVFKRRPSKTARINQRNR